jgi:uncharacterized membrane protein YgcG
MTTGQTLITILVGCFAVMSVVMAAMLKRVSDPAGNFGDRLTFRKHVRSSGDPGGSSCGGDGGDGGGGDGGGGGGD